MTTGVPCTGVILAGGGSTRFGGTAKGLEEVGGQRIIDWVAVALRSACDDLLLIANDGVARSWLPGVRVAGDLRPGAGPLGGLHAALVHAGGAVVVIAWDMPFVAGKLVGRLRSEGQAGIGAPDAVVPRRSDGTAEPLCAYYAPACIDPIERALARGARHCTAFHEEIRVQWMSEETLPAGRGGVSAFLSVNSREELARVRERV